MEDNLHIAQSIDDHGYVLTAGNGFADMYSVLLKVYQKPTSNPHFCSVYWVSGDKRKMMCSRLNAREFDRFALSFLERHARQISVELGGSVGIVDGATKSPSSQ